MTTLRVPSGHRMRETEPGLWTAEASDLGWAPGVWPNLFTATLEARGMEPELPIDLWQVETSVKNGELLWVRYQSRLGGMNLVVIND